jgi:phosphatidylglycerophosphatase A
MYIKTCYAIATGFYSGLSPKAPGTAGSAAALLILYIATSLGLFDFTSSSILILSLATLIVGIVSTEVVLKHSLFGEGNKDPSPVVIDEFAGVYLSLLGSGPGAWDFLFAFAAFRFFDILKPPPVSTVERLPRAWGIMLDDIVAGILAALTIFGIRTMVDALTLGSL